MRFFEMSTMVNRHLSVTMRLTVNMKDLKRCRFSTDWKPKEPPEKTPQVTEEILLLRRKLVREAASQCDNAKILEL